MKSIRLTLRHLPQQILEDHIESKSGLGFIASEIIQTTGGFPSLPTLERGYFTLFTFNKVNSLYDLGGGEWISNSCCFSSWSQGGTRKGSGTTSVLWPSYRKQSAFWPPGGWIPQKLSSLCPQNTLDV